MLYSCYSFKIHYVCLYTVLGQKNEQSHRKHIAAKLIQIEIGKLHMIVYVIYIYTYVYNHIHYQSYMCMYVQMNCHIYGFQLYKIQFKNSLQKPH